MESFVELQVALILSRFGLEQPPLRICPEACLKPDVAKKNATSGPRAF